MRGLAGAGVGVLFHADTVLSPELVAPAPSFQSPGIARAPAARRWRSADDETGRVAADADGLLGREGTFSLCSFWLVEALARSGDLREARLIFEKMLTYASPLGLYSEEIAPSGQLLGNTPQAFTHLALISSAFNLDRALDRAADLPAVYSTQSRTFRA